MTAPAASFKQIEVVRAIKGVLRCGVDVYEVIASKDGIRVITHPSAASSRPKENDWDEVFYDGEKK